jgi:hypothetical protein
LGLLIIAQPRLLSGPSDEHAISVDLVTPAGILIPQPRAPSRGAAPKKPSVASPSAETPAPNFAAGALPQPATPPANTTQESRPAGLDLRNSVIGCAFAGMVKLSDAQRRRCHDRFAAGRKNGPDLASLGLDPAKKAAFDAAAGLPADFLRGPPKNHCKLFVNDPRYVGFNGEGYDASVAIGCGKTF